MMAAFGWCADEEVETSKWLEPEDIQKVTLSEELDEPREGRGIKDHSSIFVVNTWV